MDIDKVKLIQTLEAINTSIGNLTAYVMTDRRETREAIADLSKALNNSTAAIRTVLSRAGKAPSESQELDVSSIRTPVPPRA